MHSINDTEEPALFSVLKSLLNNIIWQISQCLRFFHSSKSSPCDTMTPNETDIVRASRAAIQKSKTSKMSMMKAPKLPNYSIRSLWTWELTKS